MTPRFCPVIGDGGNYGNERKGWTGEDTRAEAGEKDGVSLEIWATGELDFVRGTA